MKVHYGFESFPRLDKGTVVTSGTYDGLHFGHRKILKRLREAGQKRDLETVVITFWPHPKHVLQPHLDVRLLTSLEEKIVLMEHQGIDHLLVIEFNEEFSKWSSSDFIHTILINTLKAEHLIIGYDHRFGRNREGSFEYLKAHQTSYGFEVEEIPRQELDEVAVSSTKIRNALKDGEIEKANTYLGSIYAIPGTVVSGKKLGRTINYPTANIHLNDSMKLIPKIGVYAVFVTVERDQLYGMANIGVKPTVNSDNIQSLEVHIFDFNRDIYGKDIRIQFLKYIREEKKFESIEALTAAIQNDEKTIRAYFRDEH